jgi:hypothetical protein
MKGEELKLKDIELSHTSCHDLRGLEVCWTQSKDAEGLFFFLVFFSSSLGIWEPTLSGRR